MFCGVLCVAVIDKRAPVVCCCVAAKATVCGEPGIVERLLWKDSPQQPHWAPQTHAAGLNWLRLPIRLSTMLFRKQRRCCISFVIHIHSYIYIYRNRVSQVKRDTQRVHYHHCATNQGNGWWTRCVCFVSIYRSVTPFVVPVIWSSSSSSLVLILYSISRTMMYLYWYSHWFTT